ncbi:MAG: hypothetical protein ACXW02_07240 [Halobacteriota archaeon]
MEDKEAYTAKDVASFKTSIDEKVDAIREYFDVFKNNAWATPSELYDLDNLLDYEWERVFLEPSPIKDDLEAMWNKCHAMIRK